MRYLRQNTAVTIVAGPFVDWKNGKSLLRVDADFVPTKITCELIKGVSSSVLTLTKTGGVNDIVLTGKGLATLELTAADTDTLGQLRLSFADAMVSGYPTQTIISFIEDFSVLPANVYDSLFGSSLLNVNADVSSVLTAIGGLNNLSSSDVSNLLTALATSTEIGSVLTAISEIEAGASADQVATTLLAKNGFTVGGTLTVGVMLKLLAAFVEGTWNLKTGTANTWQISDADSKTIPVMEITLQEATNPIKVVARL